MYPKIILFLFLFNSVMLSQYKSIAILEETGLWNGLYLKVKLNETFGYYDEHHYRLRKSNKSFLIWQNDLRNGEGKFYDKHGNVVLEGIWVNDKINKKQAVQLKSNDIWE